MSNVDNIKHFENNTEWKLKEGITLDDVCNINDDDGFWYDITDGGYIDPEDILGDEKQIKKLKEAIKLVRSFESLYNEIVEYLYSDEED